MAPIDAPNAVFPHDLAIRVLHFCDSVADNAAWSETVAKVGSSPTAWRALLTEPQPGVQAGLISPKRAAAQAVNPAFIRSATPSFVAEPPAVPAEVGHARQALYEATRTMMRFAPHHPLTTELFDAASEAWLAEVTEMPSLATYSASRAVLHEVRLLWLKQATWAGLNLMGHAKLPPFLDGCLKLERLFIQQLHADCDIALFGRLPQLTAVTLHACQDAQVAARFAEQVPQLSDIQREDSNIFFMLPGKSPCPNPWA